MALAWAPARGHHGAGDEDWAIWDLKAFEVCGLVAKAEFINPHLLVHVDFTARDGARATWTFSSLQPNSAVRRGFTRQKFLEWLAPGTQVLAQGFPKVGTRNRAAARAFVTPDGQALIDSYFDTRTKVAPPRMRCSGTEDTTSNVMPPFVSHDDWRRRLKASRAPSPELTPPVRPPSPSESD